MSRDSVKLVILFLIVAGAATGLVYGPPAASSGFTFALGLFGVLLFREILS